MDYFKETEWSGFYVSSNGRIKNETGMSHFVHKRWDGVYVGIIANGRRYCKKLSDLVYKYHIRSGQPIPPGLVVSFKDKDLHNCKADNLMLVPTRKLHSDFPLSGVNTYKHKGV